MTVLMASSSLLKFIFLEKIKKSNSQLDQWSNFRFRLADGKVTHSWDFFPKDPPESAALCSDWMAADFAPSHTGWLAQSSTANGWAGRVGYTHAYGNTWAAKEEEE